MLRIAKILAVIVVGTLAFFNAGCGTDHAKVRFVHASPDAAGLDAAVDGKVVAPDMAFGSASDYLTVEAGNRRVEVRPTGTTTDLINSTIDFASEKTYTLLAIEVTPVPPDTSLTLAALLKTDDNSAPASGSVKLRVIHSAPDGAAAGPVQVDVYFVAPGTDITNVAPNIASLGYQQASAYLSVPAGTYDVIVTDSATKATLIDMKNYDLTAGQIRTLVTVDDPLCPDCGPADAKMSGTPLILSDLN